MRLAELFVEAGFPPGVLNVVHGGKEQVDFLLRHPGIRGISFVGSVPVGQYIYKTGCAHLKRVQAFAGAKNHMVIMPDADKTQVITLALSSGISRSPARLCFGGQDRVRRGALNSRCCNTASWLRQ